MQILKLFVLTVSLVGVLAYQISKEACHFFKGHTWIRMSERRAGETHTKNTLDLREAATHLCILPATYRALRKAGIFPASEIAVEELQEIVGRLFEKGLPWPTPIRKSQWRAFPFVQAVWTEIKGGALRLHARWRHYPEAKSIPHPFGTAEWVKEWFACERQYAEHHKAAPPRGAGHPPNPTQQQDKLPGTKSDEVLHMGAKAPSDVTPLYASEWEIGIMVLGIQRAHEWPAIAQVLEREGLPLADPTTGARFRPAVEAFFLARHGLDGGLATNKHAPVSRSRSKLAVRTPQALSQMEEASNEEPILFTAEELASRWRVSSETLANHRSQGVGVSYIKVLKQPLYRLSDIEKYEEQHTFPKPKP